MSERKLTINQRLNIRQRRRKTLHELHAQKLLTARLLGADKKSLDMLSGIKSRNNIRQLQRYIDRAQGKIP